MNSFQRQKLVGQELVITDKVHTFLGPKLVLENCDIVLHTNAHALTITDAQFIGCRIGAKTKLANYQMWCGARIIGCTFSGSFVGNDFGHWDDQFPTGHIEDCDFSACHLDGCRFMECNASSIRLPKWPHFGILNPHGRRTEFEAVEWPGKTRYWASDLPDQPRATSILVEHAQSLGKQFGCTEDQLRKALRAIVPELLRID